MSGGRKPPECYARWMEFDAFVPVFRLHGTSRRQPWLYGPVAEAAATKAIKLRYSLLPYMYAYDRTLTQTGIGLCRPLVWDYPNDSQLRQRRGLPGCSATICWWPPSWTGSKPSRTSTCPPAPGPTISGGRSTKGPQTIAYPVNPSTWDDIPLFIKSGAIIPTVEVMDYIGQKPVRTVSLDIFPSAAKTRFTYYDDDGITYGYEKGAYFSQAMTVRADAGARWNSRSRQKPGPIFPRSGTTSAKSTVTPPGPSGSTARRLPTVLEPPP